MAPMVGMTAHLRWSVDREGCRVTAQRFSVLQVTDMSRKIMNKAITTCPVDTGNLRSHHRMEVIPGGTRINGRVYNDCEYALPVHDGHPARTVTARPGQVFRFVADGEVVFTRRMRFKRTQGRPWLRTAARSTATRAGWRFTT